MIQRHLRVGAVVAAMAATVAAEPGEARSMRSFAPHLVRSGAKSPTGARRGRPRKFSRPSRSVTLTLPEDVISTLQSIDADLSRAVVRTVEPLGGATPRPAAELTTFGDQAVIVVPPSRSLRERTGVELVPLSDGRALLAFDDGLSISDFELRLGDAIADGRVSAEDRALFEQLAEILRKARRADGVALRPRSIILLHWMPAANGNGNGYGNANAVGKGNGSQG